MPPDGAEALRLAGTEQVRDDLGNTSLRDATLMVRELNIQSRKVDVQTRRNKAVPPEVDMRATASDTEFELIRMKSLIEHLNDRLERVEAEKGGSFGSASSGRLGWVDHQALDREFARQAHLQELQAFNDRGSGPFNFLHPPPPPLPHSMRRPALELPAPPTSWSGPPLDLKGPPPPPKHPQYFEMSPRASHAGQAGTVRIQGVENTWRVVNDRLVLEPLSGVSAVRDCSPPPPPPKSTPPPSPPFCHTLGRLKC